MTEYILSPDGSVVEADAAWIAQRAIDAAASPRLIEEISRRQFFQGMAEASMITRDEALAAVKNGDIPAAMMSFIDALPEEERFAAQMLIIGATTFHRSHPLVDHFGTMQGLTGTQIDDLWRGFAAL